MTTPDLDSAALEACPFCGGDAELLGPDTHTHIYVRCQKCGARSTVEVAGHGGTTTEAVVHWNRRAALPFREEQMRERAAKVLEKRRDELVEEYGDYEPDTNFTNLPDWVESVVEELDTQASAIRALPLGDQP